MNRKHLFSIISLLMIFLIVLSGYPKEVLLAVENNVNLTNANRYDEVFDVSEDEGNLIIRFLYTSTGTDTKSGDSTLIKTPDGKVMLIDGSAPETANTLSKYLDDLGIQKIDAIVASHPHIDHVGGLTQIIYNYKVGEVYRSEVNYPSETNNNFLKAIEEKNIETVILKDGMSFNFGETKVEVFNPIKEIDYPNKFPESSTSFINDHSLVLKMTYKDSTLLLTGDIYITGERRILERHGEELQADILKIAHHGDDTSNSSPFIKAVQAKIAVAMYDRLASLGVYNSYRKNGSKAYITAIDGNIKIIADGTREYRLITEKDRESAFLR